MNSTPREIVKKSLTFDYPSRMPRDLWALPWANNHIPETLAEIARRWPGDMGSVGNVYRPSTRERGKPHAREQYTDAWGCVFENLTNDSIGEVKHPILTELSEWESVVQPPWETLPENIDKARDSVNRDYAASDKFIRASMNPRPWEQYQFLRGTENAMMDVMDNNHDMLGILKRMHEFYMAECEFWCSTDVDAIGFMDDWGSQRQLLIPPAIWREGFKPMYKDYCEMAHAAGKFTFMHSDGFISEIFDDLIEIGVDAINSQLFCMDMEDLERRAKGKITFWGEIDRQHVLPAKDPNVGRNAVRKVASHFYDRSGGCFVQFEIGLGCNPETAIAVLEEWETVQNEN